MTAPAAAERFSRSVLRLALVAAGTALFAACGSTSVTTSEPTAVKCSLTLTTPDSIISSAGGREQITITTTRDCTWVASADANWVSRVEPASGQGSGTLQVDVAPNPSTSARQAALVVNGVRAQIQQAALGCTYAVSGSGAQSIKASGGSFAITVTAPAGCAWTAASVATWLRITSGASGKGSGVVNVNVDENAGAERDAEITIAGQPFGVSQAAAACTYTLNLTTLAVPAAGGPGPPLSLTTTCAWSATTNVPWITLPLPTGSGSANLGFTVAANSGLARSGAITVGPATVTINQAACSYSVSPTSFTMNSDAVDLTVNVTTSPSCLWTAGSNVPWGVLTSGGPGAGNGSAVFRISTNLGELRSGTFIVAGQSVSVTQAAYRGD